MKRMITFALTLCLVLSLAACGQKDSGKQETADKDQTTVEEQANQPAENETDAAQDGEADAQQDTQTINGIVNRRMIIWCCWMRTATITPSITESMWIPLSWKKGTK